MILSAVLHLWLFKSDFLQDNFLSSVLAVVVSVIVGITAASFLLWSEDGWVGDVVKWRYLASLGCCLLIVPAMLFMNIWLVFVSVVLACACGVELSGIVMNFLPEESAWINKTLTIGALSIFACGFYGVSGLTPFPQSQGLIVAIGMALLAAIGLAPHFLGISAAIMVGVFIIAYIRGRIQPIGFYGAPVFGYLVGWLGLESYPEYLLPCFCCFAMYYVLELVIAVLRKWTTLPKYRFVPYNSTLYQIYDESESAAVVSRLIWHTGVLEIIMGLFQVNCSNWFSFPILVALLCAWQQYRTINWQTPDKSLRETNKEIIDSVKKTFEQFLGSKNDKNTDDK